MHYISNKILIFFHGNKIQSPKIILHPDKSNPNQKLQFTTARRKKETSTSCRPNKNSNRNTWNPKNRISQPKNEITAPHTLCRWLRFTVLELLGSPHRQRSQSVHHLEWCSFGRNWALVQRLLVYQRPCSWSWKETQDETTRRDLFDLGTTNSVVAAMERGKPTIVTNVERQRTTPSVVAYTKIGVRLLKRQVVVNLENTFFSMKRFIRRSMKNPSRCRIGW